MLFNLLCSIASFEGVSVKRHQCRRKDFDRFLGLETFMWVSTVVTIACSWRMRFRYNVVKTVVTRREPHVRVAAEHNQKLDAHPSMVFNLNCNFELGVLDECVAIAVTNSMCTDLPVAIVLYFPYFVDQSSCMMYTTKCIL